MIDIRKLRYWENHFLQAAHFTAAVSEEDRQHILELTGRKKIYIVPNGVDFEQFSNRKYQKSKTPLVLFGLADFHWMQNKEGVEILMESIWPKIKKEVKNARLWIAGKIAPQVLSQYLGEKDVLIEEVKDNREAYQKAWILVAPMKSGGGSRTKFFEAMASGLPIVTTSQGIEGIIAKNNKEAIVRDDLNKLAEESVKLLRRKRLRESIGRKAQELVKREYTWQSSAEQLDKLYEEATNARKKI